MRIQTYSAGGVFFFRQVRIAGSLLLLLLAVYCPSMNGQSARQSQAPTDLSNLPKAMADLRSGVFSAYDLELVARIHALEAINPLEKQFSREQDLSMKLKIANTLSRLGDANSEYWDYLAAHATEAINRNEPNPFRFDKNGKVLPQQPSDAYLAWARQKHLDAKTAYRELTLNDIAAIIDLASSGDRRSIPLLRKALTSKNPFMQINAALGLADLDDRQSIPLIIHACEKAPKEVAAMIAESLVYFDDNDAQHAVDSYVPPKTAKILREARAQGKTPFR